MKLVRYEISDWLIKREGDKIEGDKIINIIIPPARMGSESIAHEAEGRMGYWLRGQKGERNNCFNKIHLVGQQYQDKTTWNFSWT